MENSLNLWHDVFSKSLSDVLTRPVDLNSRHLNRSSPLKMDRSLTADFVCNNRKPGGKGNCGRKWDSTSVTVTFLYSINYAKNRGMIEIEEFGQKCQRCRHSSKFAKPSFDYDSADRAAAKLKQKILEKFYGEQIPDQPLTSHGRRERKKPHDMTNCEACLNGVCVATEGRGGVGWMGRLGGERRLVEASGQKIGQWVIRMAGSGEKKKIGMEQGNDDDDDDDDDSDYDDDDVVLPSILKSLSIKAHRISTAMPY